MSATQLTLAMQARELGLELVLDRRSEYRSRLEKAIKWFAEDGIEFTADDVRAMCGDPPKGVSTNVTGALFAAAAKAGLIHMTGYGISSRVQGHGNLTRRWVGVRGGAVR